MDMAKTLAELRALEQKELEQFYDASTEHTIIGLNHYRGEIERREANAQAERMELLTREMAKLNVRMYWMTVIMSAMTMVSLILAAVVAL